MLNGADILITGGTGSFGRALVAHLVSLSPGPRRIIVFSRDELKQSEMQRELGYRGEVDGERLRFFLGDVRDGERLRRALTGVDYVVHAAALKQVPACEYNPQEAVKTNVFGACNLVEAAIDMGVKRVIALSTDKACNPVNLYGATKLAAEKIFTAANVLAGALDTRFAVVRYGNVVGSRGSVVPLFKRQAAEGGPITITDPRMTRFWITLPQAVAYVLSALDRMGGGEIFVPKLPSVGITTLALAIEPDVQRHEVTGIRGGEKLHETLIGEDEAPRVQTWPNEYIVGRGALGEDEWAPRAGWSYRSDSNGWQMTVEDVREMLAEVPA